MENESSLRMPNAYKRIQGEIEKLKLRRNRFARSALGYSTEEVNKKIATRRSLENKI